MNHIQILDSIQRQFNIWIVWRDPNKNPTISWALTTDQYINVSPWLLSVKANFSHANRLNIFTLWLIIVQDRLSG